MNQSADNSRRSRRWFGLWRPQRATCPYCLAQLSRQRHWWDDEPRPCESCGRTIKPIEGGKLLTITFATSAVILIAFIMWGWISNWWYILPAGIGLAFQTTMFIWLWPYVNQFQPLTAGGPLHNCPRCSYDLRATPDHCPECGLTIPQELRYSPGKTATRQPPAAPSASPTAPAQSPRY